MTRKAVLPSDRPLGTMAVRTRTADMPSLALGAPVQFLGQWLQPISLSPDTQPMLQVIVNTEEEFDWSQPFDQRNDAVENLAHQDDAQRIFERLGVKPTYVVDYAVASQANAHAPLRAYRENGTADIGAHLQPWVNPPFVPPSTGSSDSFHSFAGNLPPELERAKLHALTEAIEGNFGVRPTIYRAGRYGLGPHSFEMLDELGYEIDASVLPHIDLGGKNGPDFSAIGPAPFWFGTGRRRLGIPVSAGFTGLFADQRRILDGTLNRPLMERWRVKAVASRLRLFDRITLTPEGFTLAEQKRLTRALLARGQRIFNLSYHSSSLLPGGTPYVASTASREALLARIEAYLVWFTDKIGGRFATPFEIKRFINSWAPAD